MRTLKQQSGVIGLGEQCPSNTLESS